MVAVYILLGCLALSGLVILGIIIYCTAHCWRKKCFKARQGIPTIRISTSSEDGYVSLKHSRKWIRTHVGRETNRLRLRLTKW